MKSLNEDVQDLLPIIRRELSLPTLAIVIRSAWPRLAIRSAIADSLPLLSEAERELLLRLDVIPGPPLASVSISHTPTVAGFAVSTFASPVIGFDLEDIARVHSKAVARIATAEELSQAPSPALLWCAKEAAFKALRGRPKVLSALTARDWRSVVTPQNLSLWSCVLSETSHPNHICSGLSVELSGTALSIFVAHP